MRIQESYKKFPIKFYQKPDGTIFYDSKFLSGEAKSMDDAFKIFSQNDWEHDFLYYYEDVIGVEFGRFEPALYNKKYKGMTYLGQLNLRLDIDTGWGEGEHSITYISKHPEEKEKQLQYIKNQKRQEKFDKFKSNIQNKIQSGVKKVAGLFKHEMFFPEKTRKDLICAHCGEIIPTATYYERYEGNDYHLECIWDKLCNENSSKDYQDCRQYFFSLKQYLGNWPNVGLDIQDDYEADLEFVKINDRKTGLNKSAAMYKSNQPTFEAFYNYVLKNPKCKKCYFQFKNLNIIIPSDTIIHDYKKHNTTYNDFIDCLQNINNIVNAQLSKRKLFSSPADVALCHVQGAKHYGVVLLLQNKCEIKTVFADHPNSVDNWIKTDGAGVLASQLPASDTSKGSSVTISSHPSNNIITYIKQKINP